MALVYDLIIAAAENRNAILNAPDHRVTYDCVADLGVSVDDVVTILALERGVIDDRKAWRALRREVYFSFAEHRRDSTRNISLLSPTIRDEVADLQKGMLPSLAARWIERDSTAMDRTDDAQHSLQLLIKACGTAKENSLSVLIKCHDIANAFEAEFKTLDADQREKYLNAFDSWDASTKQVAHDRLKYLKLIGQDDGLNTVLDELQHDLPHTATLTFLTAIRKSVEHVIDCGVDDVQNPDELDALTVKAIETFTAQLSESDQKRVLRVFGIEVMKAVLDVVEQGRVFGMLEGPLSWSLIETNDSGLTGRLVAGELHAYLDGDDEFLPKSID